MFLTHAAGLFSKYIQLDEIEEGVLSSSVQYPRQPTVRGWDPRFGIYDPDGMMAKKKEELTRWHADQVRCNVYFNFRQEMIDYCKYDVALSEAGCEAFQQEFQTQAGFNPMTKCMTIASAYNLYWRRHHLPADTIAVEPVRGWRGPMSTNLSRPCNGSTTRNTKFQSRGPVRTESDTYVTGVNRQSGP